MPVTAMQDNTTAYALAFAAMAVGTVLELVCSVYRLKKAAALLVRVSLIAFGTLLAFHTRSFLVLVIAASTPIGSTIGDLMVLRRGRYSN